VCWQQQRRAPACCGVSDCASAAALPHGTHTHTRCCCGCCCRIASPTAAGVWRVAACGARQAHGAGVRVRAAAAAAAAACLPAVVGGAPALDAPHHAQRRARTHPPTHTHTLRQ
jgi:hypothetical protein